MSILSPLSPNGGVFGGANLGASSDFVVINTVIAHETGDVGSAPSNQENLEKLMELVMTTTNVKYVQVSSTVVDMSVSANRAALGLGTDFNQASTTVFTIKFMAEQVNFFNLSAFASLIQGFAVQNPTAGVPVNGPAVVTLSAYETADAATKNISVSKYHL